MWLNHSQDSTGSSHYPSSYAPDSQCSDFSQINTQDIFSQNSLGTQNELSQQKKMSMYEKWLSKRTLFKKDSIITDLKPQISKDTRDVIVRAPSITNKALGIMEMTSLAAPVNPSFGHDRSLLEQIKNAFQNSTKEISSALDLLKKKLDNSTESSHELLTQTVNKFIQDVWKQQEQIYNLVNQHAKNMPSSEELQKLISLHERKITLLEELFSSTQNESENHFKKIQDFISSQQFKTDQKLEGLLKWLQLTSEKHELSLDGYKKSLEKSLKECKNQNSLGISHLEQRDKKVLSEITDVKEKMEKKFSDLNTRCVEELQVLLKKQTNVISDTNKQFFKQFNQNIYPLKNLRSQNNELVIEQCQTMVTKLEKNIKSCLINNDWNISSMQKSITDGIHQTISILLKQSQDDCLTRIMQQIENKFLFYQSHFEQDNMSNCKIQSSNVINLNRPPEKLTSITKKPLCPITNVDVKEKHVRKFHSPVQAALSPRSKRLSRISTTSNTEINMKKKTNDLTGPLQETYVAEVNKKYSKSGVDNVKMDSVYCGGNKQMKQKSRNNTGSSSEADISSSNSYLHRNKDKIFDLTSKSDNRKRKYDENVNCIGMQLKPAKLSIYGDDKNGHLASGCTVSKRNNEQLDKNLHIFETVDNLYDRRGEPQPQKKFWCENFEKKSFFQQKTFQSFKVHDCCTDQHEMANNLNAFSSQSSRSKGKINEASSCNSSPTVSITKVTIKKIKTPYKKRLIQGCQKVLNNRGFNGMPSSPAPTLLSDIDN